MPLPTARLAAALTALSCAAGCGGAPGATPTATVREFAEALRGGRVEDAYAAMSGDYRARVSFAEFAEHVRRFPAETDELVELLLEPAAPPEETATLDLSDGERLELVREPGGWRLVGNVVDFYDQSTPRAALRSFVRAMERGRYDVVLRMVPEADREGMTPETLATAFRGESRESVERMLANLRANLDAPIEEVGGHATMTYGGRYQVLFVREDGAWRIESPE